MRWMIGLFLILNLPATAQVLMDRQMTCNEPLGSTLPAVKADENAERLGYRQWIRATLPLIDGFYKRGQFERALTLLDTGLELTDVFPGELTAERTWLLVGKAWLLARKALLVDSDYDAAAAAIDLAKPLVQGYDHRYLRAQLRTARGVLALARLRNRGAGDTSTMMAAFSDGLALRRQLNDCAGVAESLLYVGMVHVENGNRAKAQGYFEETIALEAAAAKQNPGKDTGITASHAQFQMAYLLASDDERRNQAIAFFEAALKTRQDRGFLIGLPFAHVALGQFHVANGDWDSAAPHFEKGYRAALNIGLPRVTLVSLLPIGDLHRQRGEVTKAIFYYQQARDLAEASGFQAGIDAAANRLDALR